MEYPRILDIKELCTGCGACKASCKMTCITIGEDEDGFYFETDMIALKINDDNVFDLGRLVIDFFKCPECGWYTQPHHFFDKETIELCVNCVREKCPDAKGGKVVIVVPCSDGDLELPIGEYKLSEAGYNYEVDINKNDFEIATHIIGEAVLEEVK